MTWDEIEHTYPGHKIVFLTVSSYVTYVPGAEHYYGRLVTHYDDDCHRVEVDVERTLTVKGAIALNRRDGETTYHAGDQTYRWEDLDELREEARRVLRRRFPDCMLCLEQDPATVGPNPILYCANEALHAQLQALHDRAEAIGWYDGGHRREMYAIDNEWDAALREHGL